MCEKLSQEGYARVVGIDYSAPVTERMREREKIRRKEGGGGCSAGVIHYHCMEATSLSFSDHTFDAVCFGFKVSGSGFRV